MRNLAPYSIRCVTSMEEFKALAAPWNALLGRTASNNIFLTWEWHYTWAKHYLGDRRLWVILVHDRSNRLVGIAPLYVELARRCGAVPIRNVRFLGTEEVCSAYLDFIVPEKHKKGVLQEIYRHLHGRAGKAWDVLTLSEMPADSSSVDLLFGFTQDEGKVIEIADPTPNPIIDLSCCFDGFMARLNPKRRYNLKWQQSLLQRNGSLSYVGVRVPQRVESAMHDFQRLHQMRWERKGFDGAFCSRRFMAFHHEIGRLFGERGWVRLDFLYLDGRSIAGIYGYTYNDRYYFYLTGMNPDVLPEASPGILLLLRRVEEAIREGCSEFDLLRGSEGYKMAWASGIRRTVTLRHYNTHVKSALVELLDNGKSVLKTLFR